MHGEPEPPAWWQTPRRSAIRAVLWLGALGWAIAACLRAVWTTEHVEGNVLLTCAPQTMAQLVQLALALAGAGIAIVSLNVPPDAAQRRGRAIVVGVLLVLWLLAAFAWGPAQRVVCAPS